MFVNTYSNSIDEKGRCIIPAKFRNDLGSSCTIVSFFKDCLYIYPTEVWQKYANENIDILPDHDPKARNMKGLFYDRSKTCDVDKQGRINIPDQCLEHAGITKNMVNIGEMNRIRVMSEEKHVEMVTGAEDDIEGIFSEMGKYITKQ